MTTFNNNGINIYYEVTGTGPNVLLINGLGGDTRSFEPLVSSAKGRFTLINYDMRCAGRSDKPDEPFTLEQLADEAAALVKHLGHKELFVLGFSMGGMVAQVLALKYPKMVQGLVLVSSAPSLKGPHPMSERVAETFRKTEITDDLLRDVYGLVFGPEFKKKVPVEAFIKLRMSDPEPQPAFAYLRQFAVLESFAGLKDLGKISCGAVIIAGDSDRIIPHENSRYLHEHIPDSELRILKGVGHMLPIEAPDELFSALSERHKRA